MAEEVRIPLRPENDTIGGLSKVDKDTLVAHYLLRLPKATVFAMYHAEYTDQTGKLSKVGTELCRQFFLHPKNLEWLESYKQTVNRFIGGGRVVTESKSQEEEMTDDRKDNALRSLLSQAMALVENEERLDADTLKVVTEIFRKLNLISDDADVQEQPRRYIPAQCGLCSYKAFVDAHYKAGDIENQCERCRALACAKEHGFRYDPTKLLEANENNQKS